MRVDLFDFELPPERIALRPAVPRDAAQLLVVPEAGPVRHDVVRSLPSLLRTGDVVVMNDTRVIPARLHGRRERAGQTARVEIVLHRRLGPDRWLAFARPGKRLAIGDAVLFGDVGSSPCQSGRIQATVEDKDVHEGVTLRFDLTGPALDDAILLHGRMPLPPYIAARRPLDARDEADYQTVFADRPGAVAAPTAGLHVTDELLARLGAAGIGTERLTLHVGAGTFLPVKAADTRDHRMHAENGRLDAAAAERLNDARGRGGRVVALGTTSLRLLESAAGPDGRLAPFDGPTEIFITPGYRFRAVDLLVTNFHLPRSTLFMLVAAFAGLERMRDAYASAIAAGYRFYSYGDACLLERTAR